MNDTSSGPGLRGAPAAVAGLAREIHVDLVRWAEAYPSFDPNQFSGIALTSAVHHPDWCRSQRLPAALVSAWILGFDDMVDKGRMPHADGSHLARYKASIRDEMVARSEPDDDLARALRDIRRRLAAHYSFTSLSPHWEWSFDQMADAIVWQHEIARALDSRGGQAAPEWPSYETLMGRAIHSVGVPFYLASCFILYDDPTIAERLPVLIRIGEECARAIRLANDLRTWEREEREQTINSVAVVRHEIRRENPGIDLEAGRDRAIQILKERELAAIARTHTLLASSPAASSPVEAGIGRLVNQVTGFYALQDYRTWNERA